MTASTPGSGQGSGRGSAPKVKMMDRYGRIRRYTIIALAVGLHLVLILTVTINTSSRQERADTSIFKIVDLREYVPPSPPKEPEKPVEEKKPEEKVVVPPQEAITEEVIEVEEEVVETEVEPVVEQQSSEPAPEPAPPEIEYLPQHKISVAPGIPTDQIRAKIEYPPLANRQGIEGVVYLELYIDQHGVIRDIKVLKDPGYGLAEAALKAMEGITVQPAEANGTPVPVRFRYPIRFTLK